MAKAQSLFRYTFYYNFDFKPYILQCILPTLHLADTPHLVRIINNLKTEQTYRNGRGGGLIKNTWTYFLIIIYNANVCKTFTYSLVPGMLMY